MLTDIQKQLIEDFVRNKEMFEAVRQAFCESILESDHSNPRLLDYSNMILPLRNNEDVGADLRARITALNAALQVGFSALTTYSKNEPTKSLINPAR